MLKTNTLRAQPRPQLVLEELEPRILFSADAATLLADNPWSPDAEVRVLESSTANPSSIQNQGTAQQTAKTHEIVFVDTRVDHYQQLVDDIKASENSQRQIEIFMLDANRDGIAQISETLSQYKNLDAVHLISHGSDGSIDLGKNQLNAQSLIKNQAAIQTWGNALTTNGDLLIYGCNVAETQFGQSFIDYLSGLTDTDVTASENTTGYAALGGDWNLEYKTGSIEAQSAISAHLKDQWTDVLAVTSNSTVTSANSTNVGTTGNKLTWSHTVALGTDRALFVEIAIGGLGANVTGVKYGTADLVQVGRSTGNHAVEIWALVNPTVGTANVEISFAGSTDAAAGASTFNGVDQTSPYSGYVGASGTGTTAAVTVASAIGDLVIDAQYWQGALTGGVAGAGQSIQWWEQNTQVTGGSSTEAGAASVVMSGDFISSAQWQIGAVSIKAAANQAPVANNDVAAGNEDTTITGNVLTNDTDADNNALTATLVSGPSHAASFMLNADGTFSYTPGTDWSGSDSFQYLVNDGVSGITHYWGLEGNAVDSVGGSSGSLVNGPTTIAGKYGNALQFDGVDDYVLLPDVSYTNNFSLAFYFKVADNSGTGLQYFYSHGAAPSTNTPNTIQVALAEASYATVGQPNNLVTTVWDSNDTSGQIFTDVSTLIGDGQWHLYSMTVTAVAGTQVYVDGVQKGSIATGGGAIDPIGNAYLGARSDLDPTRFLNANSAMDGVVLYNRALDSSEVASLATNAPQATVNINVASVNDAPTITSGATTGMGASYSEDAPTSGFPVFGVINAVGWSDADSGAAKGMILTSTTGNGTWQYSTDSLVWHDVGAISASNGLLLSDTSWLRYVGDNLHGETPEIQFSAWDMTSGTASTNTTVSYTDPGTGGGSSAFSAQTAKAHTSISEVNDAPAGTDGTITTQEDTAYTFTTSDFGFSDPDGNSLLGIKITTLPATGNLTLNSTSVTAGQIVGIGDINSGLLKFVPAANDNGTGYTGFTFQVQDNGGTSNSGIDFDQSPNTITVNVTSVNDAPVLTPYGPTISLSENDPSLTATVTTLLQSSLSDVDASAAQGIALFGISGSGGTLEYSLDGSNWFGVNSVSDSNALLLRSTDLLRFNPATDNGGTLIVEYRGWDQTTGIAGTKVNASVTGGMTAFSAASDQSVATISSINDAPTGSVTITGTATQGQTLTASNTLADADGLGTISYKWQAGGSNISGATGNSYLLTEAEVGKTISVIASYTDGHSTLETVTSAATSAVANLNDAPTGSVTITGTATQGQTLTASNTLADADTLGTITYTWKADGTGVGTGTTYLLTEAEVGKAITVTASYTDGHGANESVNSSPTSAVLNVNDAPTGSVTITGTATQGQTLTASNTLADADTLGTITYTWKADGTGVGTGTTYLLTEAEVGKAITVTASYTDGHGANESVNSSPTSAVLNVNDAPTGSVTITGTATQGQTLTASNTLADADTLGTITYTWKADGTDVGTGTTYLLTEAEVGKAMTVTASYTDGHGANESVNSSPTSAVLNVNDAPTGSVTIAGTATQGQTLTASNTLADADGLGTISYQWLAGGSNISGATGSSYLLTEAEVGKTISVIASYTDGHGTAESVSGVPGALVIHAVENTENKIVFGIDPGTTLSENELTPQKEQSGIPVKSTLLTSYIEKSVIAADSLADNPDLSLVETEAVTPKASDENLFALPDTSAGFSATIRQNAAVLIIDSSVNKSLKVIDELTMDQYFQQFDAYQLPEIALSGSGKEFSNQNVLFETGGKSEELIPEHLRQHAAEAAGLTVSVGVMWWSLRISNLLKVWIASMPAWRHVDLLSILRDDEDETDRQTHWGEQDMEANRDEHAVEQVLYTSAGKK